MVPSLGVPVEVEKRAAAMEEVIICFSLSVSSRSAIVTVRRYSTRQPIRDRLIKD